MPSHPQRFHALDATRAFALLLGVLFHTAWFYCPDPFRTPVTDVKANHFFGWFFHTSHTFRMQLFFLIAGFFARLVIERRGLRPFVRNRFSRIVVPLAVGWLILYPLILMTWVWGRNLSGQNPMEIPPLLAIAGVVISGKVFVPQAEGGAFLWLHLWFLYYLLLLYVVTLCGRALFLHTPLSKSASLHRLDRTTRFFTSTITGALLFALLMAPILWSMVDWKGIDTPAASYVPNLKVLVAYLSFFLLGWFIHRQAHALETLFHQWRFYLISGLTASIGLYVFFCSVNPAETERPPHALSHRDIHDWKAFRDSLAEANPATSAAPSTSLAGPGKSQENLLSNAVLDPLSQLRASFPPRIQGFLVSDTLLFDQKTGILNSINAILADPNYLTADFRPQSSFKEPRQVDLGIVPRHRQALQPHLRGVTPGDYREERWYAGTKLAFSVLYAVIMVFLVYGCLGAFQALCQSHSPVWRYLADSSYWVYLIHIPLIPFFEILIFDRPWPSWIKFPLLCLVSLTVLYASYHYLVRSTFIGKTLNGSAFPFHRNPLHALRAQVPSAPPASKKER